MTLCQKPEFKTLQNLQVKISITIENESSIAKNDYRYLIHTWKYTDYAVKSLNSRCLPHVS